VNVALRVPDHGRDRDPAALLGVVYVDLDPRKRLPESAWFYRARRRGAASVVALISGWVVTEVGRQPWVVYRVMPTAAAVTSANGIPVGYATLAASYVVVGIGLAWVLLRLSRRPLDLPVEESPGLEPV
jgi:cytochrome d ubiquinol oxidase subunit I